jgi:hypothetical protein
MNSAWVTTFKFRLRYMSFTAWLAADNWRGIFFHIGVVVVSKSVFGPTQLLTSHAV